MLDAHQMTAGFQDVIDWRLQQAGQELGAAKLCLENGVAMGAMRSIYHAMFFCACALLATKEFSIEQVDQEPDLIAKFQRDFIKTGLLPREVGLHFKIATQLTHDMDFGSLRTPPVDRLQELLIDAESFLTTTKLFLAKP